MKVVKEFTNYAVKHMGIPSTNIDAWEKLQSTLYSPNASMTPYILEERPMQVTQMDIFSRMMMDRIIWLAGQVDDRMSTVVQAQLMFMDNVGVKDIILHVDTPGGSVKSGLSIVDVMNYITSDVVTVNTGMAASMGSVLLGAGTKGKRATLPSSRVMLHQVSGGAEGTIADMLITMEEAKKYNNYLFELLGSFTGKTGEQVKKDSERDFWMNASEALAYGIVDSIITKKLVSKKK